MTVYTRVAFVEAVRDVTRGNPKVPRKSYLADGPIPVLDQGQEFISGYTTTENAYTGKLPVVLFGDHTRAFKFVDFPFAMGADGVKVLVPQAGFDASFLYWYFRSADIPNAGYSRHFKFLRELWVCKPPLDEQHRIVAILNRAAKIERLRARAAEKLREFVPALFVKMFGDPVENPKGWPVAALGDIGRLDRGRSRHRPRNAPELYGGPYPFVQTGDVAGSGGTIRQASQRYSELGLKQSKMWPAGTLCVTIAANIGETGILAFDACFPDSVVGLVPRKDLATVEYVQGALDSMQARLEEGAPMAAQRNINLRILRALSVALPPVELQRRFSSVVRQARDIAENAGTGTGSASKVTQVLMRSLLGEPVSAKRLELLGE